MIRFVMLLLAGLLAQPARADQAGEFDYYVLALSWSPTWCAITGDARDAEQCDPALDHGFVLHGLWPQYEIGWPDYCATPERDPSRAETAAMADIMGSGGSAWYQWKKHGRCAGVSSAAYFSLAREAYESVTRPEVLRKLTREITLPARVIEDAFLDANPGLGADMVTVTCTQNRIQEVRVCLNKDLSPRRCGADVIRDCSLDKALLAPVR